MRLRGSVEGLVGVFDAGFQAGEVGRDKHTLVRRHFTNWSPVGEEIAMFRPQTVALERYRYRGAWIPTPWTSTTPKVVTSSTNTWRAGFGGSCTCGSEGGPERTHQPKGRQGAPARPLPLTVATTDQRATDPAMVGHEHPPVDGHLGSE